MSDDGSFRQLGRLGQIIPVAERPNRASLLTLLSRCVAERFEHLSNLRVHVIALGLADAEDSEEPPANPGHPACDGYAGSDYCRESWQLHRAELSCRPQTHWHRCAYGMFCGLVPVVCAGRCLAVARVNCPASISEEDFQRYVEILDLLIRDFVNSQADFLRRLSQTEQAATARPAGPVQQAEPAGEAVLRHPLVERALRYIEEHLVDPKLTVGLVARELAVHANYLSHVFADQVGQRMSRYIADLRIERAKALLMTTDWQIKRIAGESGHANPNWFCHVFATLTGLTPSAYRAQARRRARHDADRQASSTPPDARRVPLPVLLAPKTAPKPVSAAQTAQYSLDPLCIAQIGPVFVGKRMGGVP